MSVRQIAKSAGVSITTVSRVLNNHPLVSPAVRDRVLAAANRTRYVAAVGRRSTTNLALVYTGDLSLGSPFDAALLQGLSQDIPAAGYDLMILSARQSRRPHETYSQMFMRKGVRGAILRTTTETRTTCQAIAGEGFPVVVVGDVFARPAIPSVTADGRAACRRAVEHLLQLGHRRIAITLNIVDDHDHTERLLAYRQALQDAGVAADDRLILRVPAYRDAGAMALRQILALPDRPTAVFVTDPPAAVGLFHEAQRLQLPVPGALSVIGFDDTDVRLGVYPRMTAVCQNAEALGREALALLQQLIAAPEGAKAPSRTVECWLELHDSTAPRAA